MRYGLVVAVVLAGSLAVPASGTERTETVPASGTERTETVVTGSSPISGVIESHVSLRIPLPAAAGPRPAACDRLHYLRFRDSAGPARSADADRILVAQPGILEGAGAFDSVARNTVAAAARQGRHIEFWALDRRSNCLEDHTGIESGDLGLAIDYYYHGRSVAGRRFAGFLGNEQVGFLAHVGLEQTVRDQYDLLAAELPSQALRRQKVLCGGHSLGGVITGWFAVWDFDGDPGYRQCGGYFALDTTISTSLDDLSGATPSGALPDVGLGAALINAGLASGVLSRTVSAPVLINAETMNMLAVAGLAARTDPGGETLMRRLPSNDNIDATQRLLFSKDLLTFVTGEPSPREFRLSNAAVLGALLDDNSQPLSFLEASAGFFDGGPITDKDFPVPADVLRDEDLGAIEGLLGNRPLAVPDQPAGPLYTWRNFDRIGAADDPVYRTRDGVPFSTPADEVTDLAELARSLSEHPLDFTEQYFPTRLVTDIQLGAGPDTTHPEGLTANPVITLLAGDGLVAGRTFPPEYQVTVVPGYQHLDVLTAAPVQNGGRREIVSTRPGVLRRNLKGAPPMHLHRWVVVTSVVSLGLLAAPLPASAAAVEAPYTCNSPLGTQSVTISAELTATPNPAAAGSAVTFTLHVSDLGLTAPVTINSWTGSVDLDVTGAETASFAVNGSGGPIAANQPITGDLSGTWTPTVAGTDEVTGGDVTITANVVLLGDIDVTCTPEDPRPVGETLTVQ